MVFVGTKTAKKLSIRGHNFHLISRLDRSEHDFSPLLDCWLGLLSHRHRGPHRKMLLLRRSLLGSRFFRCFCDGSLLGNPSLSILHVLIIDGNVLRESIYPSHRFDSPTFVSIADENSAVIIRVGSKIGQKLPIHRSHRDVRIVLHLPELRPSLRVFRRRVRNVHSKRLRQQSELIAYA